MNNQEIIQSINELPLNELYDFLLNNKIVHSKYKNIVKTINDRIELIEFVFTNYYTPKSFEGIAPIISYINQRNIADLSKYVLNLQTLSPISVIRILFDCLDKESVYDGKFGAEISQLRKKEKLLNQNLKFLAKKYSISKLDILYYFISIIEQIKI